MKRIILFAVALLMMGPVTMAKKPEPKAPEAQIKWLTIDELQVKMKEKPKKVYVDMYTDWCGWCKKMEATTFTNPDVARYMNENYYCVRFNAERKDVVFFMGKQYTFDPEKRMNTLAFNWMQGKASYPTSIFMEQYYQNPMPVAGYQDVKGMEMIVKFFSEVAVKNQAQWDAYQKSFKPTWNAGPEQPMAPPAGH